MKVLREEFDTLVREMNKQVTEREREKTIEHTKPFEKQQKHEIKTAIQL